MCACVPTLGITIVSNLSLLECSVRNISYGADSGQVLEHLAKQQEAEDSREDGIG